MSRLIDISDERFWQILFDEACVEGQQAKRIEKELEKIVSYNVEEVVRKLEKKKNPLHDVNWNSAIDKAIEIVRTCEEPKTEKEQK